MKSFQIKAAVSLFPGSQFQGNDQLVITGAVGLGDATGKKFSDHVSWISDKNADAVKPEALNLGLLILTQASFTKLRSATCNFLIVENPRLTFFKIVATFFGKERVTGIEKTAVIHKSVVIGKDCYLGHHVVVEENCVIGDNTTVLHNTAILEGTIIGKNVVIGCNNTIGNYGFGYEKDEKGDYVVLQHIGNVVIHDNVEIHNNTCVDRAVLGSTILHENVKVDNLVHIAHGVVIERNAVVIANAVVAGSVHVGENAWIAPSVSIKNKIVIAPNTMTGIGAVVLKDTLPNETYVGNPATTMEEYKEWSEMRKEIVKKSKGVGHEDTTTRRKAQRKA